MSPPAPKGPTFTGFTCTQAQGTSVQSDLPLFPESTA
jgi:hypothetical protein